MYNTVYLTLNAFSLLTITCSNIYDHFGGNDDLKMYQLWTRGEDQGRYLRNINTLSTIWCRLGKTLESFPSRTNQDVSTNRLKAIKGYNDVSQQVKVPHYKVLGTYIYLFIG